jgi:uncharacterized protein YwqG
MMTQDQLQERLKSFGLARAAQDIASLAEMCVRFRGAPTDERSIPVGSSKLGGLPDLPPGIEWPSWRGQALAFLGQVNLTEVSSFPCARILPQSGLLSFFYDSDQGTWGFDPEDKGSWRVLYSADADSLLSRRDLPEEIPDYARFTPCAATFFEAISLPGVESISIAELDLNEREKQGYWTFLDAFRQERWCEDGHQILGHPYEIQGEMRLECQLVSNGLYCGDESGYRSPRRRELEPGATAWKLLLQLDSDDDAAMMWGDVGSLYFWIHENDLRIARFDDVWMILQCS